MKNRVMTENNRLYAHSVSTLSHVDAILNSFAAPRKTQYVEDSSTMTHTGFKDKSDLITPAGSAARVIERPTTKKSLPKFSASCGVITRA